METNEIRDKAVAATLEQFDFEKVERAAQAVGWNVQTRPSIEGGPPDVAEMKTIARSLLEKAWDDEGAPNCEYCHGGLRASRTDGCLSLQFVLEESYFVAALDLPASGGN
jgi:coenzyme F420-reducing hydrogenase gamma subunit